MTCMPGTAHFFTSNTVDPLDFSIIPEIFRPRDSRSDFVLSQASVLALDSNISPHQQLHCSLVASGFLQKSGLCLLRSGCFVRYDSIILLLVSLQARYPWMVIARRTVFPFCKAWPFLQLEAKQKIEMVLAAVRSIEV